MKFKSLMLITLVLLAILTIGVASAADDVASDDLAVDEEGDSIETPINEVQEDEVLTSPYDQNGFDPIVENEINLDSAGIVVDINTPDEGNFSITVSDGENSYDVDHEVDDDGRDKGVVQWNLEDLGITEVGTYFLNAKFIFPTGVEQTIFENHKLEVTGGNEEDEYYLYVNEEELDLTNIEENPDFAGIILPEGTTGTFIIGLLDEDDNVVDELFASEIPESFDDNLNWFIDEEDGNLHGAFYLKDFDLDEFSDGNALKFYFVNADGDVEFTKFADVLKTESTIQFNVRDDEDEDGDDADDGVIIFVPNGDDREFVLENDQDMEDTFVTVSVSDELQGIIKIYSYAEENDDEIVYFDKSLDEIDDNEPDSDHEGFTNYYIALNDLDNFESFIDWRHFTIEFSTEDDGPIDERSYNIEVDEENENIIMFWEDEGEDEPSGEGEALEGVEFRNANAQNNDVVIVIPIANFPENIANEFTVIVLTEEDQFSTNLNLDELEHDDSSYYLRVSDLGIDELEIGEGIGIDIIVQFYDADENPIYYAQTLDDEGIDIYNSPYIFDEASIFADDDVITFQEVPDGVDEFNVTIQKDGEDTIVKTFKFSELGNQYEDEEDEEEGGVWYALKLSDLGINETGDYEITVKFSEELSYTGNLSVTRDIDVRIHNEEWNEETEQSEVKEFTSVDDLVVNMRIAENIKGSVKLTIGENEPIVFDFADLRYEPGHPPSDGRQILLNDLKITETGTYKIKMEIYDENGDLIEVYDDEGVLIDEFDLLVTVGDNNVEFNDAYYTAEIGDVIKFTISTPISSGQYYNIYFNDELAGKFSIDGIVITNNKFYDLIWGDGEDEDDDVKFLKIGDYNVNVTFFDGESESDTLFTGSFSILSLNMAADKDVYTEDDEITITFDAQDSGEYYPVINVENAKGWGYMGPWFDEDWEKVLEGEEVTELIKDGKITLNIGKLPVGTNYIYVSYSLYESEYSYSDYDDSVIEFHDLIPIKVISPVDPALTISAANITEGASAIITITTNAIFNGNVSVKIGTSNYTVIVANGTGSLPVTGLAAGTYTATAIFEATDLFIASEKNTTFTVAPKVATAISAAAVTTTYATSKNIVVTLKDANGNVLVGKTVTIVLNGATKTLTTNAKGQAVLAIGTKLAPKKYDATIKFAGDSAYAASSGVVKVTVNKAKAKMTAKKKTFKAKKKSKKYTIVLKTDKNKALKNVKVTIKVGKKTYKAKTNSKGKATFNLKKLTKKGKYKATVKFAGNKYYKAVSKKVKITVKK